MSHLAEKLEVSEPTLPCWRKVPKRLDDGTAAQEYPAREDHFRQIYYDALDLIISSHVLLTDLTNTDIVFTIKYNI